MAETRSLLDAIAKRKQDSVDDWNSAFNSKVSSLQNLLNSNEDKLTSFFGKINTFLKESTLSTKEETVEEIFREISHEFLRSRSAFQPYVSLVTEYEHPAIKINLDFNDEFCGIEVREIYYWSSGRLTICGFVWDDLGENPFSFGKLGNVGDFEKDYNDINTFINKFVYRTEAVKLVAYMINAFQRVFENIDEWEKFLEEKYKSTEEE